MVTLRSVRALVVPFVVLLATAPAIALQSPAAQQVCYSATIPMQQTQWTTTAAIPKFDAGLGTLLQIDIQLTTSIAGTIQIESLDAAPTVYAVNFGCFVALDRPNLSTITVVAPSSFYNILLSPFDGTIDFAGTSGTTIQPTATASSSATSPPPASDLIDFTGPAGNPGAILLPVSANNTSTVNGPGNMVFLVSVQVGATVQVCYTYLPFVGGAPYCSGDGSSTACPCGNAGAMGHGCASSVNPMGAGLSTSGNASIAADSLVLHGSGMPDSAALYYQGTTQIDNVFGDGKRCAGGAILRLGVELNAAGASQYPAGANQPVSVKGMVAAGSTRNYQVWYRNSAMFCTPSTFNLTNGSSVTWIP